MLHRGQRQRQPHRHRQIAPRLKNIEQSHANHRQYIREEEVKNRIRQDSFQDYDAAPVLGDIDFAVAQKQAADRKTSGREFFLWAEAKAGRNKDIYASFVQLIITIGKAKAHESNLPPHFLGAFFTPPQWVQKSQEYLAAELGVDWQKMKQLAKKIEPKIYTYGFLKSS